MSKHEIKTFHADSPEVREFRYRIYEEDLGIGFDKVKTYDSKNPPSNNKFAYWFSDEKFLSNNFDQILLFYYNGEAVGMCGGTHFNSKLYRGVQMYYILKQYRKNPALNTLHFRHDGFFDYQIARAKKLRCQAVFISVDTFDKRHQIMFDAMKNDVVGPGHMPNSERKYTAKDLVYLENTYPIMHVQQKVMYFKLTRHVDFDYFFNSP